MNKKIFVTKAAMPPYEEFAEAIKPLWNTHMLTNMGKYHKELEEALKTYLKVKEVSLTVNGHMALEMAIQAMNFPRGSEVITTPFTFISTTHAIIRTGLKPVFCDIKNSDYTIDEDKIENLITEKTVAILPVHVYGNLCAIEKIEAIAYKYNLKVIYDAAHAFGETYKGQGVGEFGDATIFSFHSTKVFNTIEGGAVCCNNHELYENLYNLKNFGIRSEELVVSVGANAKMNELQAIMGLCNLKHIGEQITKRKLDVEIYRKMLAEVKGVSFCQENKDVVSNYAYFPIYIDDTVATMNRDELYNALKERDIYTRKYFFPLTSDQVCFKNKYKTVPLTQARLSATRTLVLPLYSDLIESDVITVCKVIKECMENQ